MCGPAMIAPEPHDWIDTWICTTQRNPKKPLKKSGAPKQAHRDRSRRFREARETQASPDALGGSREMPEIASRKPAQMGPEKLRGPISSILLMVLIAVVHSTDPLQICKLWGKSRLN